MKTSLRIVVVCIMMWTINMKAQGNGEIRGLVKDETGEVIIGAMVKVISAGQLVSGKTTDEKGKYVIKPLQAGMYDLVFSYTGYKTFTYHQVEVRPENATYIDYEFVPEQLGDVIVEAEADWKKSPLDVSIIKMKSINSDELKKLANNPGDIVGAISAYSSEVQTNENGDMYSRGARNGTMAIYVDGERTIGDYSTAALGIQNLTLITGGVPAQYGDATGGVIIITTKDYFTGSYEATIARSKFKAKEAKRIKNEKAQQEKEKRAKEIEEEKLLDKVKVG